MKSIDVWNAICNAIENINFINSLPYHVRSRNRVIANSAASSPNDDPNEKNATANAAAISASNATIDSTDTSFTYSTCADTPRRYSAVRWNCSAAAGTRNGSFDRYGAIRSRNRSAPCPLYDARTSATAPAIAGPIVLTVSADHPSHKSARCQ